MSVPSANIIRSLPSSCRISKHRCRRLTAIRQRAPLYCTCRPFVASQAHKVNALITYSVLSHFRIHDITYLSVHVRSVSPHLGCGISCPLIFGNLKHFLHSDAFWRHTLSVYLSRPLAPYQCALILFDTLALYRHGVSQKNVPLCHSL